MDTKQQKLSIRPLLEASPVALLVINRSFKINYLNRFAENLFSFKEQELHGENLTNLFPELHHVKTPDFWKNYSATPTELILKEEDNLSGTTKTGRQFPVELRLTPVSTGGMDFILAAVTDLSERISTDDQFRFIFESALHAMVLTDSQGVISMVNRQTELMFGYERNELIGQKIEILVPERKKKQHPEYRKEFYRHPKARPMGAGRDLYGIKKDGAEIPLEIGLNPVEKDGSRYVLASVIDITGRKKNEEAIRKYARQIEEKNKELEEFTNVASHDLREPLNSIISLTDIMMATKKDQLDEEGVKMLNYMSKLSVRMSEMITGLLEYARLGKSKELALSDLNELLAGVLYDMDATIKKTEAKITLENLPAIPVYALEMRLLFQNLISNALKYRKPDGSPEISISARQIDKGWQFEICDNGIGFPVKQKEKIFNLFHRLHGKSAIEGTGIGLAHCRKIAELHNGRIWAESEPGVGSTFYLWIPVSH